jgi:hypothetical protein
VCKVAPWGGGSELGGGDEGGCIGVGGGGSDGGDGGEGEGLRHTAPLHSRHCPSFQVPSAYMTPQSSSAPRYELGSPGAQFE